MSAEVIKWFPRRVDFQEKTMEDKSKTMMSLSPEKDEAIGTLAVSLLACIHVVRSKAFFILMIIIGGLLGVFQSNIIQSLIDKI